MPIRLTRALARVLPAALLLVIGLVAALFAGRRTPRPNGPTPVVPAPVVVAPRAPGLHRWGPAFVFAGLLLGGGLILALPPSDEGEGPVTVLSRTEPEVREVLGSPDEPGRGASHGTAKADAETIGRFSVLPQPPSPPTLPAGNGGIGLRGTVSPERDLSEPRVSSVPREDSDRPAPRNPATDPSLSRGTTAAASDRTRTDPADTAPRPPTGDPALAATRILGVEARGGGRLFVTGRSAAGSSVRLYLNEALVAPARIGRDGLVTFVIGGGVKPGTYEVRLDQVDAASGAVRSRVEVRFAVPDADRAVPTEAARASAAPEAAPGIVFVPEVRTARIVPGDSLWEISRKTYGEGDRYTTIYDANHDQIRDPDLIYPGQVFVLPGEEAAGAGRDGTHDRIPPG